MEPQAVIAVLQVLGFAGALAVLAWLATEPCRRQARARSAAVVVFNTGLGRAALAGAPPPWLGPVAIAREGQPREPVSPAGGTSALRSRS